MTLSKATTRQLLSQHSTMTTTRMMVVPMAQVCSSVHVA